MSELIGAVHDLIVSLAGFAGPVGAVVTFTVGVRALLLPLTLAAVRGERKRARLAPQAAELRNRHATDPRRLRRELTALHRRAGVNPAAGCLPALLQLPFFFAVYQAVTHPGALLAHSVLGVPLGQTLSGVLVVNGLFSPETAAFGVLLAFMAVLAWITSRRMRRTLPDGLPARRLMPFLPYASLLAGTVLPLAAGLYIVTSTAWTVLEKAVLRRSPVAA